MLTNFLIGFREGLEASLVVGILIAYLYRTGHRRSLRPLWIGVAAAVLASLTFGGLLSTFAGEMADRAEPIFAGVMGVVAVAFVTYMVFWMRRSARSLRGNLEGKLDSALGIGALALGVTAFIAVAREGFETALFLWSNISTTTGAGTLPLLGALMGILTAVAVEYLMYRSAVRNQPGEVFSDHRRPADRGGRRGPCRRGRGPAGSAVVARRRQRCVRRQRGGPREQLVRSCSERLCGFPGADDLVDVACVVGLPHPRAHVLQQTLKCRRVWGGAELANRY